MQKMEQLQETVLCQIVRLHYLTTLTGSHFMRHFVRISMPNLIRQQIVQYYCRRWKIEVNFENRKQYLGLGSESISVKFDNLAAFANLSCIRASFLEFKR